MTSYLIAGPASEPVSVARSKAFLRIEDDAEDGLIEGLVAAARIHIEAITGRLIMAQSWRLVLDRWPDNRAVKLPLAPLIAVTAIRAIDEDGEEHPLALDQFLPDGGANPGRVVVPKIVDGMPALRQRMGIEIDYEAGIAQTEYEVPADLALAVLTLVGHWYEHRGAGTGAVMPEGIGRLVNPYREVRI
jgi:uncharacterized phiE125 gp8 family phage protein